MPELIGTCVIKILMSSLFVCFLVYVTRCMWSLFSMFNMSCLCEGRILWSITRTRWKVSTLWVHSQLFSLGIRHTAKLLVPGAKKIIFTAQPSKLKFLLGRHYQLFRFRESFTNQVTSFIILGTIASKMVATWRVAACHLGKLKLAFTSPGIISTSPKSFLTSRIDFTVLLLFEFLKKHHLPVQEVKNRSH